MATFKLEISTPDSQFYSAQAEAITMRSRTGSLTVLAGHAPMLVSVQPGEIRIKADGEWRSLLSMDGFAEVTGDSVEMFTRAAVWEDEAEAHRSEKEKREALEKLRRQWDTGNAGAKRCVTPEDIAELSAILEKAEGERP